MTEEKYIIFYLGGEVRGWRGSKKGLLLTEKGATIIDEREFSDSDPDLSLKERFKIS